MGLLHVFKYSFMLRSPCNEHVNSEIASGDESDQPFAEQTTGQCGVQFGVTERGGFCCGRHGGQKRR